MDPITRSEVDEIKTESTSNQELQNMVGRPIKILKYSELKRFNNIEDVLGKYGEFIMLYETSPNVGHWCCCFTRTGSEGQKIISFFDSLGLMPDDQFHEICIKFRKDSGITKPYLTYLLSNTDKDVEYNQYELQNMDPDVATCGRWCVVRLRMKHLSPTRFYELFKGGEDFDSDDLVILAY
jgi:hypothetical protein